MRFAGDIVDWIIAARTDMMEKEKGRIPERVATFLEKTYRVGNPLKARGARRLKTVRTRLEDQFSRLEANLSTLNTLQNYLDSQITQLPKVGSSK